MGGGERLEAIGDGIRLFGRVLQHRGGENVELALGFLATGHYLCPAHIEMPPPHTGRIWPVT